MKVIEETEEERERLAQELYILQNINHPMIIKYRNHFQSKNKLCIVMDLASGTKLYPLIY